MKRSGFKRKPGSSFTAPPKPLARTTGLSAKTKKLLDYNSTPAVKDRIQDLLRQIVIIRDGGCILRNVLGHNCNGFAKDGHLILQADHLLTRANSQTYADSRLVVCVCKGAHGWKSVGSNRNKDQYDALVRTVLPPDGVALWDACEQDSWRPNGNYRSDWLLAEAVLISERDRYVIR